MDNSLIEEPILTQWAKLLKTQSEGVRLLCYIVKNTDCFCPLGNKKYYQSGTGR